VDPVTPAELEAAHHAHAPAVVAEPSEPEAAAPAIERR
jgi:hypothetical protein